MSFLAVGGSDSPDGNDSDDDGDINQLQGTDIRGGFL